VTSIPTDPTVTSRDEHDVRSDADIVRVRQAARTLAVAAKLSLVDQTKIVTAVSELARNTLIYGGGGQATLEAVSSGVRPGVRVTFTDEGPGIEDVELALTDGWTSGSGMGLGLSGTRRLVDEFTLETEPGAGTTVSIVKWSR
jgi:serine/threonine-protein kinase RsbT